MTPREKTRERNRRFREANPNYHQEWKQRNAERIRELERARYHANIEAARAKQRAKRKLRPNLTQWDRARRLKNVRRRRESVVRWARRNPDRVRAMRLLREFRMRSASGSASAEQITARVAFYGGVCAYCRVAPYQHLDHAIPVSRGGSNWPANLRPACAACNLSKHAKTPDEFSRIT